jgi:hypothetical protein
MEKLGKSCLRRSANSVTSMMERIGCRLHARYNWCRHTAHGLGRDLQKVPLNHMALLLKGKVFI